MFTIGSHANIATNMACRLVESIKLTNLFYMDLVRFRPKMIA